MFDIDKVYGFFYETDPKTKTAFSGLETKQGRDNLKMDLMRAVMEHPNTTRSFLQPGNYDSFAKNNKDINTLKVEAGQRDLVKDEDEFVENVNPMFARHWAQIANQMLTGKALIGVSANANAAHALFQHAKKELTLTKPFLFNKKQYNDLRRINSDSGKLITKNIAETLAAFVDNGKDPQAKYSNINSYTVDVAMSMLLSGVDLRVVQFFLSQPILEDFVEEYFNLGGTNTALNAVKTRYAGMWGIKKAELAPSNVYATNFDIADLEKNITEKNNQDWNKAILKSFLAYKESSRSVANLSAAVKIGESGLGPSDSDNLARLDMLKEDNFDMIKGATDLLEDESMFSYHLIEVIRNGRELILGTYTTNEDGDVVRDQLNLPDRDRGSFAVLREKFRNLRGKNRLSVKEIEFINKNYLDYLATAISFFKFDKQLVTDLPEKIQAARETGKYSNFLNRINLDNDRDNKITYAVYTGISGQDKHVIDRIRDSWEAMFEDDTEIEKGYTMRDLAYDLVKYSFMISGFRISPQSFSHLQPVSFYSEYMRDFNDTMEDAILIAEQVDRTQAGNEVYNYFVNNFFNQFIRNHYRTLAVVPKADIENKSNIRSYKLKSKTKLDHIVVGREHSDFLTKTDEFVPFIKARLEGKTYLLELSNYGEKIGVYTPTETLGTYKTRSKGGLTSGKMFTQWEFSAPMPNSEDRFKQNAVNYDPTPTSYSNEEFPTEEPPNLNDDNPANDQCNKA